MLEAEAADREEMAKAADVSAFSVPVTGSNRGVGLGLVKTFLEFPCPPEWVFATSHDMEGWKQKPKVLEEMAEQRDFCIFSVLVTGSNRGIGLGLVKRFLELLHPPKWVFATTLDLEGEDNQEIKELVCKHPNLVLLQLDVTNLESIQAARKEVEKCVGEGGLTILYNNAGISDFKDLQTTDAKSMMGIYSVNTIGPLLMSQAFLPLLKKAAWRSPCQGLSSSKAAIINMTCSTSSIELMAYWDSIKAIGYRCSKTALNMLTKCQSLAYAADGIMSITIHPGSVKTHNDLVAEITVEASTRGILTVLSNLCEDDNGTFLDWLGCRLPW